MTQCELPKEELVRRKELSDNTRKMIYSLLDVAADDETSLMTTYRDFYLQISFSELHPLMVFYLARPLDGEKAMLADRSNEMNLRSVLGSHSVNENFSCYNYRATLGSRQNKVFHEVNSCQWRTSVIQGLKKSVSLRVTSNLYLDEYRFRYLALDFKQGLDCITGLFNILI